MCIWKEEANKAACTKTNKNRYSSIELHNLIYRLGLYVRKKNKKWCLQYLFTRLSGLCATICATIWTDFDSSERRQSVYSAEFLFPEHIIARKKTGMFCGHQCDPEKWPSIIQPKLASHL